MGGKNFLHDVLISQAPVFIHVGYCLAVFTASPLVVWQYSFSSSWVTSAHWQHIVHFTATVAKNSAHMAPPAHPHPHTSVPVVIMPACPPLDCFLWVLQQHRTGYKSHCIITAPRFASRSARPARASDWPARLLGRPLRAGHRCDRKSRLLPWGRRLGKGLSLNCQSCSFLCASRSVLLPATRWVRSDETRCIPTETHGSRLIKARVATCDRAQDAQTPSCSLTKKIRRKEKKIHVKSGGSLNFCLFLPMRWLKYSLCPSRRREPN